MDGASGGTGELIIQQQQHVFEGHTARIFSLALCTLANGNRIAASASHDRTVRIWCLTTNSHLRTLTYKDFVWRVFLVTTALGRVCVIAFVSAIDAIHVTDFETGEEMYVVTGRLVFAGIVNLYNSAVIVTLINDVDIAIVDAETGAYVRYIRGGFEKAFRAVVSNTSHPVLVFNTWNAQNRRSSIQAYQLYVEPTEAERAVLPIRGRPATWINHQWVPYQGPPRDDAMIPANMRIVFEGDSRDGITSLVISQTGKPVICSGHYDNVVRVWDLRTLQLLMVLEGHYDWVVSVTVWKGVEPLVISGSSDGTIKVWDLENGDLICTCEGHLRDVWAVTVTTGPSHLIVSASADRTVRTWDVNPALMDRRWARRSSFAMFLACYGLVSRPSSNPRPSLLPPLTTPRAVAVTADMAGEEAADQEVALALSNGALAVDVNSNNNNNSAGAAESPSSSSPGSSGGSLYSYPETPPKPVVHKSLSTSCWLDLGEIEDSLSTLSFGGAKSLLQDDADGDCVMSKSCEVATFSVFHNVHLLKEIAAYL